MWQKGHQIRWQFEWVTKKSDKIFTKNCDKFGASQNVSPTLSPDWSQNSVNHQLCHQIHHQICHQIPWGSYMLNSYIDGIQVGWSIIFHFVHKFTCWCAPTAPTKCWSALSDRHLSSQYILRCTFCFSKTTLCFLWLYNLGSPAWRMIE